LILLVRSKPDRIHNSAQLVKYNEANGTLEDDKTLWLGRIRMAMRYYVGVRLDRDNHPLKGVCQIVMQIDVESPPLVLRGLYRQLIELSIAKDFGFHF